MVSMVVAVKKIKQNKKVACGTQLLNPLTAADTCTYVCPPGLEPRVGLPGHCCELWAFQGSLGLGWELLSSSAGKGQTPLPPERWDLRSA